MFKHILVPLDFRFHAPTTLVTAASLAADQGAMVTLLYVQDLGRDIPATPYMMISAEEIEEIQRGVTRFLNDAAAIISERGAPVMIRIVRGSPVDATIREVAASIGADLIVMGTHGRGGLAHAWSGSVTEDVIRNAGLPVLAVHEPAMQASARTVRVKGVNRP